MAAAYLERLGQRIRLRREELHLSRPEVARAMPGKTTENQIYRWEKGLHRPQDDALEALATVLQVDVGYFIVPAVEQHLLEAPTPFGEGLDERVARMESRLTGLIETQNGLLGNQSSILEEIRREQAELRSLIERQISAAREMEAAAEDLRRLAPGS